MGVAHAAVLSMLPGVSVVGAVDSDPGAARRLRGMGFRMPVARTLDALLADAAVDAVWVCTPPDSHLAVTRRCLDAGTAVFVEKPLAHTLDDARALAALASASPRPVACGYTLAFWPSFVAAYRLLQAGVVGRPERVESSMFLSQVSGPQRGWMYEPARAGGGVVASLSSHLLFVLRWYFGMPTSVRATWRHVHTPVEDELRATLVAPGCADIAFETSWCVPGYPTSLTVLTAEGPDGTLRVDNDGLLLDLRLPRCGLPAGRTRISEADLPQPANFVFTGEAYALEDVHFLRWVTGGPPPPITAAAGLEVQRMMHALYASAAAGGDAVAVPP
jgi:predicted dehydrogenase